MMINRREFVKAGAGAFFIAASGRAFGAGAASNRVRLAIVGCHAKGRGNAIMQSALKVPGVEIAWVCDVDARAREYAAAKVEELTGRRPRAEKDLRKVLEDPLLDGILSETPDHWHAYSAVLAMKAGKHVYVEKPCCFCPREGEIMVDVWRRTGKVLQVGSQRRASANVRAALAWLKDGNPLGEMRWGKCWYMTNREAIGTGRAVAVPEWLDWDLWQGPAPRTDYRDNYVHYNWHWFRRWGTAESGNNAPHFADIARWALGVRFPNRIAVSGGRYFPLKDDDWEWPDTYNMTFDFPGNRLITFEMASRVTGEPFMNASTGCLVYADKGSVFFGPDDDVRIFDADNKVVKFWDKDHAAQTGSRTDPTASLNVRHLANFVDCVRSGSQGTFAPADEGYMSSYLPIAGNVAQEIGEAVRTDPETGRPVGCARAMDLWSREYAPGWDLLKI